MVSKEVDLSGTEDQPAIATRRILKATAPGSTNAVAPPFEEALAASTKDCDAVDDDSNRPGGLVSPSVQAELQDKAQQKHRQDRLQKASEIHKTKRQNAIDQRRKAGNEASQSGTKEYSYNPFTQFLSVFSVENFHKRHIERGASDLTVEPDGKRMKSDDGSTDKANKELAKEKKGQNDTGGMLSIGLFASFVVAGLGLAAIAFTVRSKKR